MAVRARAGRWIGGIGVLGVTWLCTASLASGAGAALPDGRVYEQVTPVEKNGADVITDERRTVAAADGSSIDFASLEGIGDVHGTGLAADYVARRGPDGMWMTHGISPAQEPLGFGPVLFGLDPRYLLFSDDLSKGVFQAISPLSDAPNVAAAVNLYVRDDVLAAGPGSYDLLSDASSPQAPDLTLQPYVTGASADFSHVTFESRRNLTPDAIGLDPSEPKLYEWVDGSLQLAGILPGGGATTSQAGQGTSALFQYTNGTISRDGHRVIFTGPQFSGDHISGVLYVRDDQGTPSVADDQTVRVSASERTDCNDDPTCGPNGVPDPTPDPSNPGGVAPPATFWAASSDGSQIFFTTSEQLTDDDVNHSTDVYRFDLTAPAGSRLTRLSIDHELGDNGGGDVHNGHDVSGVIGASDDGTYLYFTVTQGQLVAGGSTGATGGPGGGERIFVWHDGTLHEVGAINAGIELSRITGLSGTGPGKWSRLTPDGTHLAFLTEGTQELLSLYGGQEYNHGTTCPSLSDVECQEAYVYDATANGGAGSLQCASCNPTGQTATVDADFYGGFGENGVIQGTARLNRAVSGDGRFVFFNSAERLTPDDQNDAIDAYEFNTVTDQVHLISSGTGSLDQLFLDASADGRDVFFASREHLRSSDRDQSKDLYDARIGGVPDPGLKVATPCSGDACRGPAHGRAGATVAPTVGADGPRNRIERRGAHAGLSLAPLSGKQRRELWRHGKVRVLVVASRPGHVSVRLLARIAERWRTIDVTGRTLQRGGRVRMRLALDEAARSALADRDRVRFRLTARYSQSETVRTVGFVLERGRG